MEVDPGSVAGTAVDRFLDEPLARGLNGVTAVVLSLRTFGPGPSWRDCGGPLSRHGRRPKGLSQEKVDGATSSSGPLDQGMNKKFLAWSKASPGRRPVRVEWRVVM